MQSSELTKILDQALETEKYTRTLKPYKRPYKDRFLTVMRFQMMAESVKQPANRGQHEMKLSNSMAAKKSCLKKLDELQPILLRDMFVNQTHTGRYLVCRSIVEPVFMTGMMLLAEDEEGAIDNLSIYNYSTSYDIDPAALIPLNSVIIVKEPSLKLMLNRSDFHIRIESPSDIQIVTHSHSVDKWRDSSVAKLTFDELNRRGNANFVSKSYHEAIRWYLLALSKEKSAKAYSNLSAAYLALDKYHLALVSARSAVELEANNEKALFRMARASYEMRHFQQAKEHFAKCLTVNGENKEARSGLARAEKRLQEERTGRYDIKHLLEEAATRNVLRMDVADYESSDIAIKHIDASKGLGVVATRPIARGTLIMASKAASIAYNSESNFTMISANFITKLIDDTSHAINVIKTIHKVHNEPALAANVYKLYAGSGHDREQPVDDYVVDVARIEAILTYNGFKSIELGATHLPDSIDGKLTSNIANPTDNCGLWPRSSYFNHACANNTRMLYIKDFQLVYASRDIAAGEEITILYAGQGWYEERAKRLEKFGVVCKCELCELDRADRERASREKLIEQALKMPGAKQKHLDELQHIVRRIRQKFAKRAKLQHGLDQVLGRLATCQANCGQIAKALETLREALDVAKEFDAADMLLQHVAIQPIPMLNPSDAEKCFSMAYEHFVGDREFFFHLCRVWNVDLSRFAHLVK